MAVFKLKDSSQQQTNYHFASCVNRWQVHLASIAIAYLAA